MLNLVTSKKNEIMKIEKLSNHELMAHFKDAVCDNNYNPSSEPYNKSGFTYDELENEIYNRFSKSENEEDGD